MRLVAASWRCCGAGRACMDSRPVPRLSRSMTIKRRWRNNDEKEEELSVDAEVAEFCRLHPVNQALVRELGEGQEVMLVEAAGVIKERVLLPEALAIAREKGLDVTVVQNRELSPAQRGSSLASFGMCVFVLIASATAAGKLPICKVMDFGALLLAKKEAFMAAKTSDLEEVHKPKEMRFSINIAEHDAEIKCRKVESHLNQGYGVTVILQFGAPIPYNKAVGEEFLTQLLANVDDNCGTCSGFTHNGRKGEIRVEITPTQGPTRGRAVLKKELLSKRT